MKLKIFENNFDRRNTYSVSRMLEKAIRFNRDKMFSYGGSFSEGIMFEPSEKEKGGIIVFSQEVNAVKLSKSKLINFVKQKFATLKNRLNSKKKIDKIADENELIGWTVGNYLDGRYKAKNGKMYGEKSMSVEIIGIDTDTLIKIAEQLCDVFSQESVLVKDYSTGRVMFVEPDIHTNDITESAWIAPDGTKYGKQKQSHKSGRFIFTRKELKNMIDSGIAKEIKDAEEAWRISDDVIGYSWNETNGFKSGILFTDKDGNLWVGNTGVAQMFL